MTKRKWIKICLMMVMSMFLGGCSLLEGLLFAKEEVPEFSFSGYVVADGRPLEGAMVDCGITSSTTDSTGYYSFSKLKKAVSVSVYKDGYIFKNNLANISKIENNVNFEGYEIFDKRGVIKNNDIIVSGAEVVAESDNGQYKTTSNINGEFYLSGLAGNVKVTVTKDKYTFFTESFSIHKEDDIVITGVADISGRIVVDSLATAGDFTLKCNSTPVDINDDLSFDIESVIPGDYITLSSSKYHIDRSRVQVVSTDAIEFNCNKYYDVRGNIKCGNAPIDGVGINLGDKFTYSSNGKFSFTNVYGEDSLDCKLAGYDFENVMVDADNCNLDIDATTTIALQANLDIGSDADYKSVKVLVGDKVFDKCSRQGLFTLSGVRFGEKIAIQSSDYHCDADITISSRRQLEVNLYKLFNANISAKCGDEDLSDVMVSIDNGAIKPLSDMSLTNLYGVHNLKFSKEGYVFVDEYSLNYYQTNILATGYKLFNILGKLHSNDIILNNTEFTFNDNSYLTDNDGNFLVPNMYGDVSYKISADGYNDFMGRVDVLSDALDIDLDYDILGTIVSGARGVADVKVKYQDEEAYSNENGRFSLKGLKGQGNLVLKKDYYTFDSKVVSSEDNLIINATYQIVGSVTTSEGAIDGLEIILVPKSGEGDSINTTTDSDGKYLFNGIVGEYILYYGETDVALKPNLYNVYQGGKYDFSNNGFSFGGKVTCGGSALEGVTVSIGSNKVTTDAEGKYSFPLVTNGGILTLSKEGYTFPQSGLNITEELDGNTNVNFESTYKVIISVSSGEVSLDNVSIKLNSIDAGETTDGRLELSGLTGSNTLSLTLNNYNFDGQFTFDKYQILNYDAHFDLGVTVKTGDIMVSNVEYSINGVSSLNKTNENGYVLISGVHLGDTIAFVKANYNIPNKVISEYSELMAIDCSYRISGNISNCGSVLQGVIVTVLGSEEKSAITNIYGDFVFDNIVGSVTLRFEKNGFAFNDCMVNSADNLTILSMYSIGGVIKLSSGSAISGVGIFINNELKTTTDSDGRFNINNLSTLATLQLVKQGYVFEGEMEISEPNMGLEYLGSYSISGYVKTGTRPIANATISIGDAYELETDSDGYYEISGIDREVSIRAIAEGYLDAEPEYVTGYSNKVNFNLVYTVIISITGDYTNITISITGETNRTKTYTLSEISLDNLMGENTITISKTSYAITPMDTYRGINIGQGIEIATHLMYNLSGYVKTEDGLVVPNATVLLGDNKTTTTNSQGYYEFTGVTGKNSLRAILPFENSASEGLEKVYGQVEKSGSYDIVYTSKVFYLNLLNYSYDKLRNGNGYQIVGTGKVVATATLNIKSENDINVHYKQDKNGIKVFENMNIGNEAAGVDPNVSLLTVYDTKTNKVWGQYIAGKDNVSATNTAYTDSWDLWNNGSATGTPEEYLNKFGVDIRGFSAYIIKLNTIKSVSKVSVDDKDYVFKMELDTSNSCTNYEKLMSIMCNKKDVVSFDSMILTFTISKSGYIKEMKMAEKYTVVTNENIGSSVLQNQKASVVGDLVYKFYTNEISTINDLDITSPKTATSNLATLEPSDDVYTLNAINSSSSPIDKVDLIICKKEELL